MLVFSHIDPPLLDTKADPFAGITNEIAKQHLARFLLYIVKLIHDMSRQMNWICEEQLIHS